MSKPIPDKMYFRIGEAAELIGVEPYVLRYWETEFSEVKPFRSKSGQRLYKKADVERLAAIKELLHEERYTIEGAREHLREAAQAGKSQEKKPLTQDSKKLFLQIKDELKWCIAEMRKV